MQEYAEDRVLLILPLPYRAWKKCSDGLVFAVESISVMSVGQCHEFLGYQTQDFSTYTMGLGQSDGHLVNTNTPLVQRSYSNDV